MFKKTLLRISLSLLAAVSIASIGIQVAQAGGAHGGGHRKSMSPATQPQQDNKDQAEHGHAGMPAIGQPGKASEVARTIVVTLGDGFFTPEEINVKQGETIRFTIANKGDFVHEFNIGTPKMHEHHQKEMMMMMEHGVLEAEKIHFDKMKMAMGNGKTMEHNDPNSVLLEPGKSGEIIWKFSQNVELEFACNVPGHYEAGMVGEILIRTVTASK